MATPIAFRSGQFQSKRLTETQGGVFKPRIRRQVHSAVDAGLTVHPLGR